jgi:uncharacterized protein
VASALVVALSRRELPNRLFREPSATGSLFRAMKTIILLSLSNIFMTFAWYAHLKELRDKPWIIAALISWGVALFEYLLQVPANRAGYGQFDLGQLKIMQEIIALTVFVPFALFYMKEPLRVDFLWAGLCLVGAAYFMFRTPAGGP